MSDEIVFGGDATDIPPGTYQARLAGIYRKTSDAFGAFLAWDFELSSGSIVGGATSENSGPKSKAGAWIAALLGRKLEPGERVTPDDLVGRDVLVVVGLNAQDWPKVDNVLPAMARPMTEEARRSPQKAPGRPPAPGPVPVPVPAQPQAPGSLADLPF